MKKNSNNEQKVKDTFRDPLRHEFLSEFDASDMSKASLLRPQYVVIGKRRETHCAYCGKKEEQHEKEQ